MKKRIRIGEFLLEKAIAAVAFASLSCIVLIFIFVFREAAPILWGGNHKAAVAQHQADDESIAADGPGETGPSESYGDEPAGSARDVGPSESYGDAPSPSEVGPSETYGDPPSSAEVGPSESYGDDSATLASGAAAPSGPTSGSAADLEMPESITRSVEDHATNHPITLGNLGGKEWQPVSSTPKFGILPLVTGSLKVSLIAILIAAPLGILSALFTSTFAPRWAKELMKPVIEILAGIPSVVIGFFALVILASLMQDTFHYDYRLNALLGGVAMSLAVIPIIYTLSEDALAWVPKSYTEGSLALGATAWETNLKVVLPAAIPGIFASILLGIGRAFGETMIVLMATGNAALMSFSPTEPVRTISASIGAEMAEVVFGDTHYTILFLLGALLFLFSFGLNAVAEIFVRDRLMKKFGGAV